MSKTPIIGAGTDFTINADGYIQSFITDSGNPNQLLIPAGNWNFEMWFSASSGGGSPSFYVELHKWDGTALTSIASSLATPENITGGISTDLYTTALSVPTTTLALTDRLAIRVYVIHSGRTITLHTEDSHLCQIITTFTTGLTALNGLTDQVQNFATPGTTGTAPNWSSVSPNHTLNIPLASAASVTAGLISKTDYDTFTGKQATITGAATTITSSNLTVSKALVSNPSGKVDVSTVSSTELSYVAGVTSAIQTQLNAKLSSISGIAAGGDLTGTYASPTIATGAVTLAKMANLATDRIIGNNSGSTGVPLALTSADVTAMLNLFSTAATTKGLVPGSNGVGSTYFLNAAGAWAVPAGGGGGGGTTTNSFIIKADSGTTEGTDLYTFDGALAKTINIVAGTNVTISKTTGTLTISSTAGSTPSSYNYIASTHFS
jgi:hypothetical protein